MRDFAMRRLLLASVLFLFCTVANAKPQILTWQMPLTDCDGDPINPSDFVSFALIYDTEAMPMPSDTAGPCATSEDPGPPSTASVVSVPVTETSTILNLQPGITYYFRARVCTFVATNCSAWSVQISKTVPYGRPDRVILSNGWSRIEYEAITDQPIVLFRRGSS